MTKEEIRSQRLIEDFPNHSRGIRIKALWARQKRTDSVSLTIFLVLLLVIGFLIVALVALYWPREWDDSPVVGLAILLLAGSALMWRRGLKGQVLRVWRYLKKRPNPNKMQHEETIDFDRQLDRDYDQER